MAGLGLDVVVTWGTIPGVYSSGTDAACRNGAGACNPPIDLYGCTIQPALGQTCPRGSGATTALPQKYMCQGSLRGHLDTDCESKVYLTDWLTHLKRLGVLSRVVAFEPGNEVNLCAAGCDFNTATKVIGGAEFDGSISDLAAWSNDLAATARPLLPPGATITTPNVTSLNAAAPNPTGADFLGALLAAGLDPTRFDAVSEHSYLGVDPELHDTVLAGFMDLVAHTSLAGKPVWNTEWSWSGTIQNQYNGCALASIARANGIVTADFLPVGNLPSDCKLAIGDAISVLGTTSTFDGTFTVTAISAAGNASWSQTGGTETFSGTLSAGAGDVVLGADLAAQGAFLARAELLEIFAGVRALVWYGGTSSAIGTLCDEWTTTTCTKPREAAIAYGELIRWLADADGATIAAAGRCTTDGTIYACGPFAKLGPPATQAVAMWAPAGSTLYSPPASYTSYRDTKGGVHAITPSAPITIGHDPILLQSQ